MTLWRSLVRVQYRPLTQTAPSRTVPFVFAGNRVSSAFPGTSASCRETVRSAAASLLLLRPRARNEATRPRSPRACVAARWGGTWAARCSDSTRAIRNWSARPCSRRRSTGKGCGHPVRHPRRVEQPVVPDDARRRGRLGLHQPAPRRAAAHPIHPRPPGAACPRTRARAAPTSIGARPPWCSACLTFRLTDPSLGARRAGALAVASGQRLPAWAPRSQRACMTAGRPRSTPEAGSAPRSRRAPAPRWRTPRTWALRVPPSPRGRLRRAGAARSRTKLRTRTSSA